MTNNIKTTTISDNIIITVNIVTEEVADSRTTLLVVGFSVPLGMAVFRSGDDVTETDVVSLVIRLTVGAIVVLQSASFRTSQCLFSYSEGPLHVKFGNVETLLDM
jgi:hypothetical protein